MSAREWAGSWRLALRMGARDARRNKARSLLVAVMVGLPVLAGAAIDVAGRSAQLDPQDIATVQLGDRAAAFVSLGDGTPLVQSPDASASASVDGADAAQAARNRARVAAALPPGHRVPYRIGHTFTAVADGDRVLDADLVEVDYDDPWVFGWVTQTRGKAPGGRGEVAVTEAFARRSDVRVGDDLQLRGQPRDDGGVPVTLGTVRVVGVVTGGDLLNRSQVIGRPGTLLPARGEAYVPDDGWFVTGPPVSWQQVQALNALGAKVVSRAVLADPPPLPEELARIGGPSVVDGTVDATVAGIVGVAAVLVLLQITLLAGPAQAVGARRNQRSLALVASAGGSPAVLRRTVLASGLVVGLATSLACSALGLATVALARGWLERATSSPLPRIDVHVIDLLLVVAVGTGTAVAAAVVPAIQAGRQDVVAALAGRRGQGAPRGWVAVAGLVLVGAGLATAVVAALEHAPFLVAVGLALGEFGLVALSGTLVVLAGRLAPRLPLASRLALRDAARQRGRTAPAVAAVLAVVAGCSAVAMYTAALDRHDEAQYSPQAAVGTVYASPPPGRGDAAAAAIEATMPVRQVIRLTTIDEGNGPSVQVEPVPGRSAGTGLVLQRSGGLLVDDGGGVAALVGRDDRAVRGALAAGKAVVFDPYQLFSDGTVHLRVQRSADDGSEVDAAGNLTVSGTLVRVPGVYVQLPLAPGSPVLPPGLVPRLGGDVRVTPGLILGVTTRMPTDAEEQRLRGRLTDTYTGVERGYVSPYPVFLLVIAIASVVVALGSTLAVVGLSAAEGRADVATLAAVGAAPRVRRRLAAAQAGVVAVLGTVLGTVSGVVSGITLVLLSRDRLNVAVRPDAPVPDTWDVVVPWRDLGLLAVALPLLAVLAAAAFTRSRLPMVRRLGQ